MTSARYTVKAAAARAGITPHVLRLWERRFDLLDPARSRSGYRLYSDDDVLILSYVARQRDAGASLADLAQRGRAPLLADARRERAMPATELVDDTALCDLLEHAQIDAFERALARNQGARSYAEAIASLELPLAGMLAARRRAGELSAAAERLGVSILRRRLSAFVHNLGSPSEGRPIVAGGARVSDELTVLGIVAVAAVARVPVIDVGIGLPVDELVRAATRWKARGIVYVTRRAAIYPRRVTVVDDPASIADAIHALA